MPGLNLMSYVNASADERKRLLDEWETKGRMDIYRGQLDIQAAQQRLRAEQAPYYNEYMQSMTREAQERTTGARTGRERETAEYAQLTRLLKLPPGVISGIQKGMSEQDIIAELEESKKLGTAETRARASKGKNELAIAIDRSAKRLLPSKERAQQAEYEATAKYAGPLIEAELEKQRQANISKMTDEQLFDSYLANYTINGKEVFTPELRQAMVIQTYMNRFGLSMDSVDFELRISQVASVIEQMDMQPTVEDAVKAAHATGAIPKTFMQDLLANMKNADRPLTTEKERKQAKISFIALSNNMIERYNRTKVFPPEPVEKIPYPVKPEGDLTPNPEPATPEESGVTEPVIPDKVRGKLDNILAE